MTNTQLYLAIGIPSFLVLLNTAVMLGLFGNLSGRIDGVGARLDGLGVRFDGRMDGLAGQLKDLRAEARADQVETRGRVDRVARMFTDVHMAQGRHDARLDALEGERKA